MIVIKCKHVNQNEEPQLLEEIRRFLNDKGLFPHEIHAISKLKNNCFDDPGAYMVDGVKVYSRGEALGDIL